MPSLRVLQVRMSMQQRAYRKEPKSFSYPSDPLWENQWSLVRKEQSQ